jgi:galactokinase/mevalonate kinase-like predicted kinase
MGDLSKIALAIVTLGLVATLVVNGANTAKVIGAGTGGFATDLTAAEKG